MGNPLLDISATVKPELLARHGLKSNDAILTEDEQIFKDLTGDYQVAGGETEVFPIVRGVGVGGNSTFPLKKRYRQKNFPVPAIFFPPFVSRQIFPAS